MNPSKAQRKLAEKEAAKAKNAADAAVAEKAVNAAVKAVDDAAAAKQKSRGWWPW